MPPAKYTDEDILILIRGVGAGEARGGGWGGGANAPSFFKYRG